MSYAVVVMAATSLAYTSNVLPIGNVDIEAQIQAIDEQITDNREQYDATWDDLVQENTVMSQRQTERAATQLAKDGQEAVRDMEADQLEAELAKDESERDQDLILQLEANINARNILIDQLDAIIDQYTVDIEAGYDRINELNDELDELDYQLQLLEDERAALLAQL